MPEEFEGDLAGAVFWGADLSGARFRDVNLTNAKISHAWLVNVDIDALVDTVVINGVDVTDYVNERDPWYPLRAMLRPSDPEGMRATWAALEEEWAKTLTRALALPERRLHESVNGEWSFVQTLRHLVFAMDKWFTAPILERALPPDGAAEQRLGRLPLARPELDLDTIRLGGARGACRSRRALSRLPRDGRDAPTSHDRSTCSRTAPIRCESASTPSSKRSSGTTATRSATSRCSQARRDGRAEETERRRALRLRRGAQRAVVRSDGVRARCWVGMSAARMPLITC